ncbi:MAG: lipocalin-like domain-containing protein [Muribaculaceae bacterium]|nr:lipocalin-like domain-containing protein [Muribaculaceae bacterium]
MKNILAIFIGMLFLFSSCQKSPINGNLDGQWQVMAVTPQPEVELLQTRIYYCFSLHTCQLSFYGPGPWTAGNILQYTDKSLVLEFPYANSEESVIKLRQYGINTNPVSFTIETLTKEKMVLRDGDTVVELRKF